VSIDDGDGKLDYLVAWLYLGVVDAGGFEVEHQEIPELRLYVLLRKAKLNSADF
jgi:hypothetical protein